MSLEHDDLSRFQDAYLDYIEGGREEPPQIGGLPEELRKGAESFVRSITAARGIDPHAARPPLEQLLKAGQ